MAYMILLQAITVGAHLGAVFNLALWYLLMLAMTMTMALFVTRMPRSTEGRLGPDRSGRAQVISP